MTQYTPDFIAKTNFPLDSLFLYENRRWYKEKTSQIFNKFKNNYIDLWYEVPYYGKTDGNGILYAPIASKTDILINERVASFDFILEAAKDMIFFFKRAHNQGALSKKMTKLLGNFKIKRAFIDSKEMHVSYATRLLEDFNQHIIDNGLTILDFKKYICELLRFLDTKNHVLSYYYIFAGPNMPICTSALSLEFHLLDQDNDKHKNAFFQDPSFEKYVKIAASFGFRVNKNAPWMLIADLNSLPMSHGRLTKRNGETNVLPGYMPKHFIPNSDFLFKNFYSRVAFASFDFFKEDLRLGYKKYQNNMFYLIEHNKPQVELNNSFNNISGASIKRFGFNVRRIKTYKSSSSKDKISPRVELSDLQQYPEFDDKFYFKFYEQLLKYEFSVKVDKNYNAFRRVFDDLCFKHTQGNFSSYSKILNLLENYYSMTRIFDVVSGKPNWASKKKTLTNKKNDFMIPKTEQQPNNNKHVIEYSGNINDFSNF